MKCNSCGADIDARARFCPYCGTRIDPMPSSSPTPAQNIHVHVHQNQQPQVIHHTVYVDRVGRMPDSPCKRGIALLLCLFLGMLGAHRFYTGKIGTGLLYLVSGGLFGIGWICDLLSLLLGSPLDKEARRLRW